MQLIEVKDKKQASEFLEFAARLYKNEKNWIRPLDNDINKVFDKTQNRFFDKGEAIRWLLVQNGKTIGRIAAFYNLDSANAKENEQPTGGAGFFECINDQNAANVLFDAAKNWLVGKGMEAMDAPINFGQRDDWWGLLVDGFHEPVYTMPYNFAYYQQLFEVYGFQNYFKQFTYRRDLIEDMPERLQLIGKRVTNNPDFSFKQMDFSKDFEKLVEDFRTVYNKGWAKHAGVNELSPEQMKEIVKKMKPIFDPRIVFLAYHKQMPIGFYIQIPDLNQIIKHLNGKMNIIGKIKFLYYKFTKGFNRNIGLVYGVIPEFQNRGVEMGLVYYYYKLVHSKAMPYRETQLKWIGDFNPKMMRIAKELGTELYKTHHTYRLLFDKNKPFKRYPIL